MKPSWSLPIGIALLAMWPAAEAIGEGEVIILRQVPPRIAYREGLPGPVTSKAEVSPRGQIVDAVGEMPMAYELGDSDIALVGGSALAHAVPGALPGSPAGLATGAAAGGAAMPGGAAGVLGGINALVGGSGGAVVDATRGIGRTVNDMLGSMPLGVAR